MIYHHVIIFIDKIKSPDIIIILSTYAGWLKKISFLINCVPHVRETMGYLGHWKCNLPSNPMSVHWLVGWSVGWHFNWLVCRSVCHNLLKRQFVLQKLVNLHGSADSFSLIKILLSSK